MFRLSGVLTIILAVFLGTLLFQTSQSVQKAEKKLSKISREANSTEESLRVLTAEWDYLNRPERLEALALDNLDLDADITQKTNAVGSVKNIPEPLVPAVPQSKPTNLMQHVSTGRPVKKIPLKSSAIQKSERESFEDLLSDVVEEQGQ